MNLSTVSEGQKSRHNLILCSGPHWTEVKVLAGAVVLIWRLGSSFMLTGCLQFIPCCCVFVCFFNLVYVAKLPPRNFF